MYTMEQNEQLGWDILDPDGDHIATVEHKDEAECLLTHLNRG